jgi:hypothetical protein
VNYEIGLKLNAPKLVWVYGPTPPGLYPDILVFRQRLKSKNPVGKRVIADDGYRGEPEFITIKKEFDLPGRSLSSSNVLWLDMRASISASRTFTD